jgi:hypothetical protein
MHMYTLSSHALLRLHFALGYLMIALAAVCGLYADVGWHVLVVEAILRGLR